MGKGWTPERRAKQAEAIKRWKPWEKSTGPRTEEGKRASSGNALVHGYFSAETNRFVKEVRQIAAENRVLFAKLQAETRAIFKDRREQAQAERKAERQSLRDEMASLTEEQRRLEQLCKQQIDKL